MDEKTITIPTTISSRGSSKKYFSHRLSPYKKVPKALQKKRGPKPRTPLCHPERRHVCRGLCRECVRREDRWKYRLGILFTVEDYNKLLAQQNGVCAICLNPPPRTRRLALDHDHKNGQVRGLLCYACNRLLIPLIQYRVTPERIERAAKYLKKEHMIVEQYP